MGSVFGFFLRTVCVTIHDGCGTYAFPAFSRQTLRYSAPYTAYGPYSLPAGRHSSRFPRTVLKRVSPDTMYHVRLEQFEGPFSLLLSLIEKEKLDITRLSLAKVADQYLEHLAREDASSLPNLSQFLTVASRLILLKSRALLPQLTFSDEEDEEIGDLESRLREYRRYKEASEKIGKLAMLGMRSFRRESFRGISEVFVPPTSCDGAAIREAFLRVLGNMPLPMRMEERVVEETVTIEERIVYLENRIVRNMEAAFSEVALESKDRIEIVVSFLALLELVRRKTCEVDQQELFGEIRFRRIPAVV